jgi:hypothetical protein
MITSTRRAARNKTITGAIDAHIATEQDQGGDDDGSAGALCPLVTVIAPLSPWLMAR